MTNWLSLSAETPGGVAALGYGSLALKGEELRIRVKRTPAAYRCIRDDPPPVRCQ